MAKLTLFAHPSPMGKFRLVSLAERVYSKNETAPEIAAEISPEDQRNAGLVLRFNLLAVLSPLTLTQPTWQENLSRIDLEFLECIQECVSRFHRFKPKLMHPGKFRQKAGKFNER